MKIHANIYANKIKKIYYLKNELKIILLKSIFQDKKTNCLIKSFVLFKINKLCKKSRISFQKNICLILSKHRSVYSKFNMKRHTLKKLNTLGKIPNITSKGW